MGAWGRGRQRKGEEGSSRDIEHRKKGDDVRWEQCFMIYFANCNADLN